MAAGLPQQPQDLTTLLPDVVDQEGLIDSSWFKVVITKCPTGGHDGTASVSLDRHHGQWTCLPKLFYESALIATSQVPLKELILKHHRLNSMPPINSIHSVSPVSESLILLDISHNQFEEFCSDLCSLSQLKQINAMANHIIHIPLEVTKLLNLQTILLQNNRLEHFPESLCQLHTLKHINLENNKIKSVPEDVTKLSHLKELYLKSNRIEALPQSISELCKLEVLHLADNKLCVLPSNMYIVKLKQLHLAHNMLTELPVSLGSCSNLQGLTVGNNPLLIPPPSVCRKGIDSIILCLKGKLDSNQVYYSLQNE